MKQREYVVCLEGVKNNEPFGEALFTTTDRDEALKKYAEEKVNLENDEEFFLHNYVGDSIEHELHSRFDIPMPCTTYEGESKLNRAELFISIDYYDDERDLSLDYYKQLKPKKYNAELEFIMEGDK